MKSYLRRIIVLFIVIMLVSLSFVIAKTTRLDKIILKDKSETITVTEPIKVTENNEITSKIEFNVLNDYVVFELSLKNIEENKYKISKIQDNNTLENIEITYDYDKNYINPNETSKVLMTIKYVKLLEGTQKIDLNDLEINIELTKEDGTKENVKINEPEKQEEKSENSQNSEIKRTYIINNIYEQENDDGTKQIVTVTGKNDSTSVITTSSTKSNGPSTGDYVVIYIILLIIATFVLALTFKKSKRNLLMLLMIMPLLGVSILTHAEDQIPLKIKFTNVVINVQETEKTAIYTVKHKYIKVDGTIEEITEEFEGIIGQTVTPKLKSREYFDNPDEQSIVIKKDEANEVIYVYRERERNKFVSYNQELHVDGVNLVNKYGELVVLEGIAIPNGANLSEEKFNRASMETIRYDWNTNVTRIPMDITNTSYCQGYVEHPELIEKVYNLVDICIDLDMYAIVDWHVLKNDAYVGSGNPLTHIEYAKDFFTKIATKYKDYPNIIYEICNEPLLKDGDTWESVTVYANEIIPLIRSIDSDSLILVNGFSPDEHDFEQEKLRYDNLMYVFHVYPSNLIGYKANRVAQYIEEGIPVFITEFGITTDINKQVENPENSVVYLEEFADRLIHYMRKYNISWTNWSMSDGYAYSIVKKKQWNNELREETLNPSGLYMKNVLLGKRNFDYLDDIAEMMGPRENVAFWSDEYRNNITKVKFENSINKDKVNNAVIAWDITSISSNKKVVAYLEKDPDDENCYYLFIAGEGEVRAFISCESLFRNFRNVREIDLTHFDTSAITTMQYMFDNCKNLNTLILGDEFDTSNTSYFYYMFNNCNKLENLDTSKIDIQTASTLRGMFVKNYAITSIDLSNFTNRRLTTIGSMFRDCEKLNTIDLSGFKFESNIDYTDAFKNIRNGGAFTVIVKDETEKEHLENIFETDNITNGYVVVKGYTPKESFADAFNNGEYEWSDIHEVAKIISGQFGLTKGKVNRTTSYVEFTYNNKEYKLEVGDEFTVKDTEDAEYRVRIIGFNSDKLASESNIDGEFTYEGEYAGITFEFINQLWRTVEGEANRWSIISMNSTDTNEGGWEATSLRAYLNSEKALGILTNNNYIKTVKKEYNIGNKQKENASTPAEDKLWLLAGSEIYNSKEIEIDGQTEKIWGYCLSNESTVTEGIEENRYIFYVINNPSYGNKYDILKRPKTTETEPSRNWWLRSPNCYSDTNFCGVMKDGKVETNGYSAISQSGVAPAFSI